MNPFHLAIPVHDLDKARQFYKTVLNCKEGRSDEAWVDFNFFGHQLVCHLDSSAPVKTDKSPSARSNPVDGHDVPIPHFGVVLSMQRWQLIADRLKLNEMEFLIEPCIRFQGRVGEQGTMFFTDPSGNVIEIKGFKDIDAHLFAARSST